MLFRPKKNVFIGCLVFICWSMLFVGGVWAAGADIKILVNGQELYTDVAPEIKNGRTMVPLRAISEGLGMQVEWLPDSRTVVVSTPQPGEAQQAISANRVAGSILTEIKILVNGIELYTDVAPEIKNDRTMVPLRAISEGLGMKVEWLPDSRMVTVNAGNASLPSRHGENPRTEPNDSQEPLPAEPNTPAEPAPSDVADDNKVTVTILGESIATSEQLRAVLKQNNPNAPDLVDYYLQIGREYGIRGDLAFCQAAKETGWWKFGGLVKPEQNNYCGLGATGQAATGEESLNGADPGKIRFIAGDHGAYFTTPADGVEAQIQHLYAYASTKPLPAGKVIIDPRYTLVKRGIATYWSDLDGRWAVPGIGYGKSVINDYYRQTGAAVEK